MRVGQIVAAGVAGGLAMEADPAAASLSRPDLLRDVEALARTAAARPSSPEDRQASRTRLEHLRTAYRSRPDLFDPPTITLLKQVADDLEAAPAAGLSPREVLRSTFGYAEFRTGQAAVIDAVLAGHDCIAVMPTGAGKSLTYQIPARILGGTTLVVSPLIALMKDQVDALTELGIRATFINTSLDPEERRERVAALRAGQYELVYAAPEGIEASLHEVLVSCDIRLVAVDDVTDVRLVDAHAECHGRHHHVDVVPPEGLLSPRPLGRVHPRVVGERPHAVAAQIVGGRRHALPAQAVDDTALVFALADEAKDRGPGVEAPALLVHVQPKVGAKARAAEPPRGGHAELGPDVGDHLVGGGGGEREDGHAAEAGLEA